MKQPKSNTHTHTLIGFILTLTSSTRAQDLELSRVNLETPNRLSIRVAGDQSNRYNITQIEKSAGVGQPWTLIHSGLAESRGRAVAEITLSPNEPVQLYRAKRLMEVVRTPESNFRNVADFGYEPKYAHVGEQDLRIAYYDIGEGQPIVLLPTAHSWSYYWKDYIEPLVEEAKRRVICVDPIGFGRSDKPIPFDALMHTDVQTQLSELIFEHLDLNSCTIYGPLIYADIVARLAVDFEDRVDRLIVTQPQFWDGSDEQYNQAKAQDLQLIMNAGGVELLASFVIGFALSTGSGGSNEALTSDEVTAFDAPHVDATFRSAIISTHTRFVGDSERPEAQDQKDYWEQFKEWDKPLLVIHGAPNYWGSGDWPERFKAIPGAVGRQHVILSESHDFLEWRFRDQILPAVLDFLSEE